MCALTTCKQKQSKQQPSAPASCRWPSASHQPPIHPPIHPPIYPSIHPSVHPSTYQGLVLRDPSHLRGSLHPDRAGRVHGGHL